MNTVGADRSAVEVNSAAHSASGIVAKVPSNREREEHVALAGLSGAPHLATRDRTDLRLKWEKTDEPVQSTTDAFAVSDDCVLEITLTAFTGEDGTRYLVTLTYKANQ